MKELLNKIEVARKMWRISGNLILLKKYNVAVAEVREGKEDFIDFINDLFSLPIKDEAKAEGGRKSKRVISPEAQLKMQEGRKLKRNKP